MSIEEKAIAYVLGSLSEQEREGVARERLFHRALDREIEQVERVYSALADAPARRRPAERLWGQLVAAIGHEEKALADKLVEPCTAGDWQDFGPNIEFKTLWSPKAILIRCGPGAFESQHDQPPEDDEHIIVIAGDLKVGGRRFGTGDYLCVPAGAVHARMDTAGGCMLFTEYRPIAAS